MFLACGSNLDGGLKAGKTREKDIESGDEPYVKANFGIFRLSKLSTGTRK